MNRTIGNTISVLIVTLFVALAVFGTVQLTGRVVGTTAIDSGTNVVAAANVVAASNSLGADPGLSENRMLRDLVPRNAVSRGAAHAPSRTDRTYRTGERR